MKAEDVDVIAAAKKRHSLCPSAQLCSTSGMICGSKPPPRQSKKVCVVGAGMAGLAAARELRWEGHDVTVLEQGHDIGGQWLYDPRTDDTLVAAAAAVPVKVHSSMYASVRLVTPREIIGYSDFPFVPREGAAVTAGRDHRRFPGHRELYCYLKDFCEAFALMDAVRLNTKVLRVAMEALSATRQWAVRSVHLGDGDTDETEEVFDAVVVATGHYSQPRLPRIDGMEGWKRRQLHSHSYRVPEPFRGEVVVVVGCGQSGTDIAMELRGVAKEVHLAVNSVDDVTPGLSKVLAKHSTNLHLHVQVDRLHDDGRVAFADGSCAAVVDTVIYCTGYNYSFPFLDTGGAVTVDDNRVGPLFEHVFPPSLAPSLSFVGVPRKVFVAWTSEVQARWVAQVLSGRRTLPPEAEMVRAVEERYRAMEIAGVPKKYTHDVGLFEPLYMNEFWEKYGGGLPRVDGWKFELLLATMKNRKNNLETFRDDYEDSDSVREAVEEWRRAKARNQDDN